jgi:APA family basic amino acid/polyamine antiporter
MVRQLGSAGWLIAMWVPGTITVIAAELRWVECDVSKAGGQYIYIKEAYGKLVGFYIGVSLPYKPVLSPP